MSGCRREGEGGAEGEGEGEGQGKGEGVFGEAGEDLNTRAKSLVSVLKKRCVSVGYHCLEACFQKLLHSASTARVRTMSQCALASILGVFPCAHVASFL